MTTDQIMGSIEDLQMGDHLCCLYETEKEHKNILTPYIIQGLENNEKIVYILDKHTKNTVKTYIQDMDLDANSLIESGQFVFLSTGESYILDGHFHPDSMITLLQNSLDVALQEGYSALRVTGEMSWILKGLKGSEKFIEYESKLNQFFPGKKCIGLCQYNLTDFNNNLLLDVLLTHPKVALADKIYKNIYYIPTSQYHANNLPYSTFETWIKNLKRQAKYEDILTLSEKRYRNLFENSPISLWEEDFSQVKSFIEQLKEDGVDDFREYFENNPDIVKHLAGQVKLIEVNQRTLDIYKAGDISEFRDYLPYIFTLESIETFKEELISIAEGKTCFMSESVTKTLDGDKNYIMLKFNVSPGYEKDYSRVIISIIDLTKRKLMEDELKKVMGKNEMLLKEIHHRVKNNLQIISSILNLQSFYLTDKKSLEALTDCKNRVRSMGMVHEKLYQSGDFAKIEVKDYIESVALEIFKSYALNPEQIKVKMEIEDISLDINHSIAIGLIVNELFTNSIKYAFPQKKGNIEIKISKKGDDKISMLLQDDGIGFPADFELVKSETLGLQLVNNLVSQLDGEITLDRSSGTKFIIEFPLI